MTAMMAWVRAASVIAGVALVACAPARAPKAAEPEEAAAAPAPAPAATAEPVASASPSTAAGAMPPPTPKKPGCLDSTRGAKHTFVGKLERHPDGSGAVRVKLPKRVCFSGGRFSAGDTDEVILDIDDAKAKPLLAKKVKVSGTSQDYAPTTTRAYVMRLEVTALAVSK